MRSQAQRAYLWAKHPEIAREFEAATPKGKQLPEHVNEATKRKHGAEMNRRMRGR